MSGIFLSSWNFSLRLRYLLTVSVCYHEHVNFCVIHEGCFLHTSQTNNTEILVTETRQITKKVKRRETLESKIEN